MLCFKFGICSPVVVGFLIIAFFNGCFKCEERLWVDLTVLYINSLSFSEFVITNGLSILKDALRDLAAGVAGRTCDQVHPQQRIRWPLDFKTTRLPFTNTNTGNDGRRPNCRPMACGHLGYVGGIVLGASTKRLPASSDHTRIADNRH